MEVTRFSTQLPAMLWGADAGVEKACNREGKRLARQFDGQRIKFDEVKIVRPECVIYTDKVAARGVGSFDEWRPYNLLSFITSFMGSLSPMDSDHRQQVARLIRDSVAELPLCSLQFLISMHGRPGRDEVASRIGEVLESWEGLSTLRFSDSLAQVVGVESLIQSRLIDLFDLWIGSNRGSVVNDLKVVSEVLLMSDREALAERLSMAIVGLAREYSFEDTDIRDSAIVRRILLTLDDVEFQRIATGRRYELSLFLHTWLEAKLKHH